MFTFVSQAFKCWINQSDAYVTHTQGELEAASAKEHKAHTSRRNRDATGRSRAGMFRAVPDAPDGTCGDTIAAFPNEVLLSGTKPWCLLRLSTSDADDDDGDSPAFRSTIIRLTTGVDHLKQFLRHGNCGFKDRTMKKKRSPFDGI